jgi:carbon monoxide dehydrogenase subunit G
VRFENSFTVTVPLERVWEYVLDIPSLAPCIPGAELTEVVSPSEFKGTVTVKLGAVKVAYRGTVELTEIDRDAHRVVLRANGSETHGAGAASGTVTSTLTADAASKTTVTIVSEIIISGRVAQFGRNIMQDVSNRLIQQFAVCLEANLSAHGTDSDAQTATAAELNMLPVMMDVTKAKLARGLTRLSRRDGEKSEA